MSFTTLYNTYYEVIYGWGIRDGLGSALSEETAHDVFLGYIRSSRNGCVVRNGNHGSYLHGIYLRVRPHVVKVLLRDRRIKATLERDTEVN